MLDLGQSLVLGLYVAGGAGIYFAVLFLIGGIETRDLMLRFGSQRIKQR